MKRIALAAALTACAPRSAPAPAPTPPVRYVVQPGQAALHVRATDGATDLREVVVRVDGAEVGRAPYDGPVASGTREISIRAADGRSAKWSGDIDGALAVRLDVRAAASNPRIEGSRLPIDIDRTIKKSLEEIELCHRRVAAVRPGLTGKIVVNFLIRGDGVVEYARIKSSTMKDIDVESCITREFLDIHFGSAEPGVVTVNYPILFR